MGRILVAMAAIALALFFRYTAQDYPRAAARLPTLLGWAVILLALLAIGGQLMAWRRQSAEGALRLIPAIDTRAITIGVCFAGLSIAYAAAITVVGYLIATPVFLLVSLGALRPIGWSRILITTALVTGVIWAVFIHFLGLPLPLYPGA
ncbi:tripartite tricarboxylate transporter TctB family protein [Vannielia litorea]|uniref:tripartite tricarboxylate transporter TctB family protein n=1 Tax=Vannielia TaxID=2813041 RepID=UPI001C97EF2D|nr:tripartite tricarboxylate transporter TctB family protein [Vannielia litorea]MBY6153802.1 tripartite tricarboxylate transporter TctB family protein [Vannielia litorea]